MKLIWRFIVVVLLVVVIIPILIFVAFGDRATAECEIYKKTDIGMAEISDIEDLELEEYIVGVVAAEMPASFPIEALKAQAVASRTYALRQRKADPKVDLKSIGQAYIEKAEMQNRWGDSFNVNYNKICEAVYSTSGEVMVYEDEPILAVFSACSNGKTEVSENVWGESLPYLKSVKSEMDINAPDFEHKSVIAKAEFANKLGISDKDIENTVYIEAISTSGYVNKVCVGTKSIKGTDFREIFGLKSSSFTIEYSGENVIITTKGYGHGVGMSQYGAKFMAEKDYDYKGILKHYYTEISIKNL